MKKIVSFFKIRKINLMTEENYILIIILKRLFTFSRNLI